MTNYEIIKAHYTASENRDLDAMLAPITAETVWIEMAGFPCAGAYHGPREIVENVFKVLGETWRDYTLNIERILDAGDTIIGIGAYSGIYKETGKYMEARVTHVWDLKHGKVVRFEQFTDTLLVAEAMKT